MPTHRTLAGIAGLCAIALAATTAPTTAVAAPTESGRPAQLLDTPASTRVENRGGERSRAVRLDTAALEDARAGDRVTLALFDDTSVTAVVEERRSVDGTTTWLGGIEGESQGSFSAVEVGGVAHINVTSTEHGAYEVSSGRAGDYVVTEAGNPPPAGDDAVLAPVPPGAQASGTADRRTSPARPSAGAGAAGADPSSTIDVAIVYPAALVAQMGADAMQAQFAQGIAQTNQALTASGIPTQVRLVGTRQTANAQLSNIEANYYALGKPGDGVFDEAQALREETHADLVSLWLGGSVAPGATCGLGSLGGTDPQYDHVRAAWTVLYAADCATKYLVFAHELGHNFSADHDAGASFPPKEGKPYARGYVDVAARTITVMAYYDQCAAAGVSCTRIGYYSNPNVSVNGRVTGTAAANNAQAVAEQAAAVASYRQSQIHPGEVAVTGRPRFTGTAVAASTPWSPAVTLGYQWFLDGVAVPGATGSEMKLTREDIGRSLTVLVTGSAPYYASVPVASAPVVVGKALFRTTRPRLRGTPRAGRVLSVRLKGWKPTPGRKGVKVRYQWMRNGKAIKGAKGATYRVQALDRGKKIQVKVRVKAKGYETAKRTSKKVRIRR